MTTEKSNICEGLPKRKIIIEGKKVLSGAILDRISAEFRILICDRKWNRNGKIAEIATKRDKTLSQQIWPYVLFTSKYLLFCFLLKINYWVYEIPINIQTHILRIILTGTLYSLCLCFSSNDDLITKTNWHWQHLWNRTRQMKQALGVEPVERRNK